MQPSAIKQSPRPWCQDREVLTSTGTLFSDRQHAGQCLATAVKARIPPEPTVVLGLPRGGVPVAAEVAKALHCSLDVCVARKLGTPGQPELAMGAIAEGDVCVLNHEMIRAWGIDQETVDAIATREREELNRRVALYRKSEPPVPISGQTVVLVDDGIATGATVEAAIQYLHGRHPTNVVLATPVAAASTLERLASMVDAIVVLATPEPFECVGMSYGTFRQTTDKEVCDALEQASNHASKAYTH